MSWLTLVKKAASLIPTPPTGKGRIFIDDGGVIAVKSDAGTVATFQSIPKGYIDGLKMEWVSGTQLRVTSGSAYVPGTARVAELAAAVTLSPSLAANSWYHCFLTDSGSAVGVEAVATAPAAPYFGTARAKTGDTSRRYIGSFRTNASAQLHNFIVNNGLVSYRQRISLSPFRVLSNGMAAVPTNVSCANVVPVSSRLAYIVPVNQDPTLGVQISSSDSGDTTQELLFQSSGATGMSRPPTLMHLDENQALSYSFPSTPSGGFYVDVWGYFYER